MRKNFKLALCGLGLFAVAGFGIGFALHNEATVRQPIVVLAEEEEIPEVPEEPEVVELPCQVVLAKYEHGSISVDIKEGNVGDICTITAKHDLLYKVASVSVNEVELIESEATRGEFRFALVEGENKISASFVVDEELCGTLTTIVQQAGDKDWTRLFSVENVIILVKWILDGGILIAMIRYYIKDKRLEKKLENKVQQTIAQIIPETTEKTVLTTVEKVITPMFEETKADYVEIMKGLTVFAKCMALAQENTPESRNAILDVLSGLKIGDLDTINEVKRYIEDALNRHNKAYEETLKAIKELGEKNANNISEKKEEKDETENPQSESVHAQATE